MNRETEGLREEIAELEHIQWQQWASSLLPTLDRFVIDHSLFCDCELCKRTNRWRVLITTPYTQLTEEQKDQDRVWADKLLRLCKDSGLRWYDGKNDRFVEIEL